MIETETPLNFIIPLIDKMNPLQVHTFPLPLQPHKHLRTVHHTLFKSNPPPTPQQVLPRLPCIKPPPLQHLSLLLRRTTPHRNHIPPLRKLFPQHISNPPWRHRLPIPNQQIALFPQRLTCTSMLLDSSNDTVRHVPDVDKRAPHRRKRRDGHRPVEKGVDVTDAHRQAGDGVGEV